MMTISVFECLTLLCSKPMLQETLLNLAMLILDVVLVSLQSPLNRYFSTIIHHTIHEKNSKFLVCSGPYTEIWNRKTSKFGRFSRSDSSFFLNCFSLISGKYDLVYEYLQTSFATALF